LRKSFLSIPVSSLDKGRMSGLRFLMTPGGQVYFVHGHLMLYRKKFDLDWEAVANAACHQRDIKLGWQLYLMAQPLSTIS
jgi:hypothetical protein